MFEYADLFIVLKREAGWAAELFEDWPERDARPDARVPLPELDSRRLRSSSITVDDPCEPAIVEHGVYLFEWLCRGEIAEALRRRLERLRLAVVRCDPDPDDPQSRGFSSLEPHLSRLHEEVTNALRPLRREETAAARHLTRALPALGQVNGRMEGAPLLDWLAQKLGEPDRSVREAAAEAVGALAEKGLRVFRGRWGKWTGRSVAELRAISRPPAV